MRDQMVQVLGRSTAAEFGPAEYEGLGRIADSYPSSIVIFDAVTLDSTPLRIAVDIRLAGPIEHDLSLGDGPVYAVVDNWQVIGLTEVAR